MLPILSADAVAAARAFGVDYVIFDPIAARNGFRHPSAAGATRMSEAFDGIELYRLAAP